MNTRNDRWQDRRILKNSGKYDDQHPSDRRAIESAEDETRDVQSESCPQDDAAKVSA